MCYSNVDLAVAALSAETAIQWPVCFGALYTTEGEGETMMLG